MVTRNFDALAPLTADPGLWPILGNVHGQITVEGADHVEHVDAGLIFHRLPETAIRKIPMEFFRVVEAQPTGVRLVTLTRATSIELLVTTTVAVFFPDDPVETFGRFNLLINGQQHSEVDVHSGGIRTMDVLTNTSVVKSADPVRVRFEGLPAHDKKVEIWLPHDVEVTIASIHTDAPMVAPPTSSRHDRPIWLHYGSSISHGVNAQSPIGTWPAVAAMQVGMNLRNLGFSGNALLDPFVADTIRDSAADIISLEIGINVINHDAFRVRTFVPAVMGFLDTIREQHATTPIWIVSSVLCPVVENRPGLTLMGGPPGARRATTEGVPDEVQRGRLSLSLTRDLLKQLAKSRSQEDSNVHYLDGRELYGRAEYESMPMQDDLHPDADAHRHMGERFAELVLRKSVTQPSIRMR